MNLKNLKRKGSKMELKKIPLDKIDEYSVKVKKLFDEITTLK